MRHKGKTSWECDKCDRTREDDDNNNELVECWECSYPDMKNVADAFRLDYICSKMKSMETKYKADIERVEGIQKATKQQLDKAMDELYSTKNFAMVVNQELHETKKRVIKLEARSSTTLDTVLDVAEDVRDIKKDGTCLNDDNIRSIKKIAKKTAIKQIVKWDSD